MVSWPDGSQSALSMKGWEDSTSRGQRNRSWAGGSLRSRHFQTGAPAKERRQGDIVELPVLIVALVKEAWPGRKETDVHGRPSHPGTFLGSASSSC